MRALDFNTDTHDILDYIVDKIYLAESGDAEAIRYIEFLWGEDPDMLDTAYIQYYAEEAER